MLINSGADHNYNYSSWRRPYYSHHRIWQGAPSRRPSHDGWPQDKFICLFPRSPNDSFKTAGKGLRQAATAWCWQGFFLRAPPAWRIALNTSLFVCSFVPLVATLKQLAKGSPTRQPPGAGNGGSLWASLAWRMASNTSFICLFGCSPGGKVKTTHP